MLDGTSRILMVQGKFMQQEVFFILRVCVFVFVLGHFIAASTLRLFSLCERVEAL